MPVNFLDAERAPIAPSATTYAAFVIAVLSVQLVPGPEAILILSRGIGQGRRIAVWTVVGMTLVAGSIQLPLLALGVASVIRSSPVAFELLRGSEACISSGLVVDFCFLGDARQRRGRLFSRPG
jgi:LysE type translocator